MFVFAVAGAALWQQVGPRTDMPLLDTYVPKGKAADLVLEGTYYWSRRTPDDLNRALQIFTNAIAEDPAYAPGYVGIANCYNLLREYTLMPAEEAYPKARAAAERAIALDPKLAEAHSSLAFGQFYWFWDSASAIASIERAIALDPNSVQTRHWHATMLMYTGDFAAALAEITRAQTLDPQSRAILADKGLILYYTGARDEAKLLLRQLAEAEPEYYAPAAFLSILYLHEKRYDDHFRWARTAATLIGDDAGLKLVDYMTAAYRAGGEAAMLEAQIADQRRRIEAGGLETYWLARTMAYAGNPAEAIRLLGQSVERHEQSALILRIDPAFSTLHGEAGFRALVEKTGLPLPA